jgi:hypothetical protein
VRWIGSRHARADLVFPAASNRNSTGEKAMFGIDASWTWISILGLGGFHGLNPAMGWLFAVALGFQQRNSRAVITALGPIALGHALSIGIVVAIVWSLGLVVPQAAVMVIGGGSMVAFVLWKVTTRFRHPAWVGMQVTRVDLVAWSFLMATAHGAGLMLIPALMPICFGGAADARPTDLAIAGAVAATLVHSASMLIVTGVVAVTIYEWVGLSILRSAWINVDFLWTLALAAAGVFLLVY